MSASMCPHRGLLRKTEHSTPAAIGRGEAWVCSSPGLEKSPSELGFFRPAVTNLSD